MKELIEKYREIFQIPDNIQIELAEIPQGQELIYISEENKAIFKLDQHSIQDIPELMAQLKLGIDYSPLLATMYFQPNMTKEEKIFASNFFALVIPVIDAWVWRIMKEYLPEEEMEKEIEQLDKLWVDYQLYKMYAGKEESDYAKRRLNISQYLIRRVLELPAQLKIIGKDKKLIQEWVRYKKLIEETAVQKPDINLLVQLPDKTNAPYKVVNREKYLEIRKRDVME